MRTNIIMNVLGEPKRFWDVLSSTFSGNPCKLAGMGQYRADAGSIGPVLTHYWPIMACLWGCCHIMRIPGMAIWAHYLETVLSSERSRVSKSHQFNTAIKSFLVLPRWYNDVSAWDLVMAWHRRWQAITRSHADQYSEGSMNLGLHINIYLLKSINRR